MDKLIIIVGYIGRMLVYVGLICACILIWGLIVNTTCCL